MNEQLSLISNLNSDENIVEINHSVIQSKLQAIKPETYNAVGSMHKYWGKKPYNIVAEVLKYFTVPGQVILDPFCGSGVTIAQAVELGRKGIGVDLNPAAVFISKASIAPINIKLFDEALTQINESLKELETKLYSYECACGQAAIMNAAVRTKSDIITRLKLKCINCGTIEREVNQDDVSTTEAADALQIVSWYPSDKMHRNGRINVKSNQKVSDLYSKRNLHFCAELWKQINTISDVTVREALKLAFTANLSNASKLTPIIRQRGPMNAGAWMTGYYVGAEYLEQNVLHYFLNRARKVRKAKEGTNLIKKIDASIAPEIHQANSENLSFIKDGSIDFVFTDPPYGDSVPYMEQSLLWNSWLGYSDDVFENEIVISDSPERTKKLKNYVTGLNKVFAELARVTRPNASMCITFHSMKGSVWTGFVSAVLSAGFEILDALTIYQKTSTPRQLNRVDSIKCDFLLVFKKTSKKVTVNHLSVNDCKQITSTSLNNRMNGLEGLNTDQVFSTVLKELLIRGVPSEDFDLIEYIADFLEYRDGLWRKVISQ